eukprot:TRINITY_DN44204_c0_g1_i1.p1 TRINITY_DN44204_c0_g1~~TRINITY_DN44204_c0_g1_i1.p1  ORF type:complete len:484 (+),score=105.76 TRINITY_DN44204_c0_g1_i1:70-1452(+)
MFEGREVTSPVSGRPLSRRSSAAAGASAGRQGRSSRVRKSWIATESDRRSWTASDASQAGIAEDEALRIVTATTRFATGMCVIIAITKVCIYLSTEAEVVRTSALDSLGDLMANMITLYTGYRMANMDEKRYPAGQGKFQSIGCLVFSTLMFALMFGNALANMKSLAETKDDIGFQAISRFFAQTGSLGGDFEHWHNAVSLKAGGYVWKSTEKLENPLKPYFAAEGNAAEKAWAAKLPDEISMKGIVSLVAEYENEADKWEELKSQNFFLGCCATYKLCLYLYCILEAIPKSGSSVLVALATDNWNYFICTSSVIVATTFCACCPGIVGFFMSQERVDPFVSLVLSCFIMYSWAELMIEHMTILSQEAATLEFSEGVKAEVRRNMLQQARGSTFSIMDEDIKVYKSGLAHTVEVNLNVNSAGTPFAEVAEVSQVLRTSCLMLEDVERALIFPTLPAACPA